MKAAFKSVLLGIVITGLLAATSAGEMVPAESERGYLSSDLSLYELETVVGQGFISTMSPEEIRDIDARGLLPSPEAIQQMTRDLYDITIKGVRIVIDTSKFSKQELVDTINGWERFLAKL